MKTLKILVAALLSVLSLNVVADDETAKENLTIDYALKSYIDAFTAGKVKGFPEVLAGDVKFTETRGERIINYSKQDILNNLKNNANIQQNCTTEHTIIDQNPAQAIIKVTMKYDAFSKVNLVTLSNTGKGWKITNVSSSYI